MLQGKQANKPIFVADAIILATALLHTMTVLQPFAFKTFAVF